MSGNDRVDDLRSRVVGKRYYDKSNDESLTVVGLSVHEGNPILSLHQYDDGVAWDEAPTPDLMSPAEAEQFRVEEGGIDSERYVPLGPGPTIGRSRELCSDDGHDWTPRPDDIWPDGIPESKSDTETSELYNRLVRCKRCGLSGDVALQFDDSETPWFCARCEEVEEGEELAYLVEGWEDLPVCADCKDEIA